MPFVIFADVIDRVRKFPGEYAFALGFTPHHMGENGLCCVCACERDRPKHKGLLLIGETGVGCASCKLRGATFISFWRSQRGLQSDHAAAVDMCRELGWTDLLR